MTDIKDSVIESLQYSLTEMRKNMNEIQEQNRVLQARNTELVKDNRYLKKTVEQMLNEGTITLMNNNK